MKKKLIFLIFFGLILSLMVACTDEAEDGEEDLSSDNEQEEEQEQGSTIFENDYITFQHPEDWIVNGSGSDGVNVVTIGRGAGYDFVLEAEEVSGLETEEDFEARLSEEFAQGLEAAEEDDYITQLSFEDITLDGYEGKSLYLDVELLEGTAEALYQVFTEDLANYDRIRDYLTDYESFEAFLSEIRDNEAFIYDLHATVTTITNENSEPDSSLEIAQAYLENIQNYQNGDVSNLQRQMITIVTKENLVLRVYFFSEPERFEDIIDQVREIIGTIEFVE